MAQKIGDARILDLKDHGRRLLEVYTEPWLSDGISAERHRRSHEAVNRGLYEHLWQLLERWQQGVNHYAL
jgi:hypothetical protein